MRANQTIDVEEVKEMMKGVREEEGEGREALAKFLCDCGQSFPNRNSSRNHKKKCKVDKGSTMF